MDSFTLPDNVPKCTRCGSRQRCFVESYGNCELEGHHIWRCDYVVNKDRPRAARY